MIDMLAWRRHLSGYQIVRPDLTYTVPGVRDWLRSRPDGGWGGGSDIDRWKAARRMLFIGWLVSTGRLSDGH